MYMDNSAHIVSVLEAATTAANASGGAFDVTWSPGVAVNSLDATEIPAAVQAAAAADVAIVVVGDSAEGVGCVRGVN
jgi:thiamine biosynthesis lipoprotein ApbE